MSEWTTEPGQQKQSGTSDRQTAADQAADAQQQQAQQGYLRQISESQQTPAVENQGLANYEESLGKFLGKPLYKAVSKQITPENVYKHAERAIDKGIKYLVEQLDGYDTQDQVPDAVFDQVSAVIKQEVDPAVEAFLKEGYGKEMVESLAGWVDRNPRMVATIAILAAIGAILANADVPKLKTKFKIADGITARFSAKLGQFQNIHLEEVRGELQAQGTMGDVKYDARLYGQYTEEHGESMGGSLRLADKDEAWWLKAGAEHDHTGQAIDLSGGFQRGAWYGGGEGRYHTEEGKSWGAHLGYKPTDRFSTEIRGFEDQARGKGAEAVGKYRGGRKSNWAAEFSAGHSENMGNTVKAGFSWSF
ncbi:MAG: hypothetical protein ACE366_21710 [Bradymonadia bacterium]